MASARASAASFSFMASLIAFFAPSLSFLDFFFFFLFDSAAESFFALLEADAPPLTSNMHPPEVLLNANGERVFIGVNGCRDCKLKDDDKEIFAVEMVKCKHTQSSASLSHVQDDRVIAVFD